MAATQSLRDVRQYIFLDECGVTTDLLRRYGRSPRGARLHDHTPCSHWQTHTVVAALRRDGLTAPAVFDGPIDSSMFLAYVEQVLVPTLHRGDVVVLHNLAVHKQPEVRAARPRSFDRVCELIAAAIALFTPAECANYVRHSGYRVATALRKTL